MKTHRLVALLVFAGLAGCGQKSSPTVVTEAPGLVTTFHDIMKSVVDPSSAIVWKVPASISEPEKSKPTPAQLDADWATLRKAAVALAEAPNLLVMEGRKISTPGIKLQDEGLEGNLSASQIEARIKANRPMLLAKAKGLQTAALATIVAIDSRNQAALEDAGGKIDEACEACHQAFWYPPNATAAAAPK
ncbi:MAG: hypothetical protein ABIO39_14075 [Caulobacteraceae bacterium]